MRSDPGGRTIAQHLRHLIALTTVPFAMMVAIQGYLTHRTSHNQAEELMQQLSNQVAVDVAQRLGDIGRSLKLIAARPGVVRMNPNDCDPGLQDLIATQAHYANVLLVDPDGWVICGAAPPSGGPRSLNFADREWFRPAMEGAPLTIGKIRRGQIVDTWIANVAGPVRNSDGKVVGAVSFAINLSDWWGPAWEGNLPPDAVLGVIDMDGKIVFRSPDAARWVGSDLTKEAIFEDLKRAGRGAFVATGVQGYARVWAATPLKGTRWIAFSGTRLSNVGTASRIHSNIFAAMMLVMLVASVALAVKASAVLSDPMKTLAETAARVAAGDTTVRAKVVGPAEIAAVATQLNQMLDARDASEQALRESEYRWKFAIDGSGDGLWDWHVAENTVYFSLRWKQMLGYSENEIGSELDEWTTRIHPEDKAEVLACFQNHLDGKTPAYSSERRALCKDGSFKWILDRSLVVSRDEDGKPLRVIGTHSDISERKQVVMAMIEKSEALRKHSEELDRFNRLAVGRELDLIDLKRQVNALARELGRAEPFNLAFADEPSAAGNEARNSSQPAAGASQ